ncbi:Probable serine/threonine-protein kinase PBL16 [Linum grandiflorum]
MRKLPSNPEEVEDFRRDSAANPLVAFTFEELKKMTGNFRQDRMLGGGGFGNVYKGLITDDLRDGTLQPVQVAVKVHDGHNSYQGHREWLVKLKSCRGHIPGAAFTPKFGEVDWILLRGRTPSPDIRVYVSRQCGEQSVLKSCTSTFVEDQNEDCIRCSKRTCISS